MGNRIPAVLWLAYVWVPDAVSLELPSGCSPPHALSCCDERCMPRVLRSLMYCACHVQQERITKYGAGPDTAGKGEKARTASGGQAKGFGCLAGFPATAIRVQGFAEGGKAGRWEG
ncbi:hypothetical protein B0I37DRAFT_364377 [Chaetomium sp. MPI-CAGE-AT-0009]|nr:hypothetical protein B0I37DRAFT_364377 [Chaetomium sp. MPI-CAGE-AT-0009]